MGKAMLVDTDVKAGEALLNKLDRTKFDVKAALWFYMPDSEDWRLIIASPTVDAEGPKKAYEKVQSQLQELEQQYVLTLANISVVSPSDNRVNILKAAVNTGPGVSHIRFTGNVINNVFIEDAYIYRLT
jgi:hypothetical protein